MSKIFYHTCILLRDKVPNMTLSRTSLIYIYIILYTILDINKGRKFRVIQEDNMKRIVETMAVLFMLVLVVAAADNPSLSAEVSTHDCFLDCYQSCKKRWPDNPFKSSICESTCDLFCQDSLTDVIYSCILDCAESMSTSSGSGTKTIIVFIFHSFGYNI